MTSTLSAFRERSGAGGWQAFGRRCVTVPLVFVGLVCALVAIPLWMPVAWLFDRAASLRGDTRTAFAGGVFLSYFLACEAGGVAASGAFWLASPLLGGLEGERYLARNFDVQCWWASALLRGAQRIFGFRIEVKGEQALHGGPMLLLLRHASMADTLLAAHFISRTHRIRLRYVLKRELLWVPCIDINCNRLPNYFVRRGSSDSEREVHRVQALMDGLEDREGILIYPEGTRFTPQKRARVLDHLRASDDPRLLRHAESLEHVLPPRLGGTLALLEHNDHLDVVVGVHSGFERTARFSDLWSGTLRHAVVHVEFWRIPRSEIPTTRAEQIEWLLDQWQRVDAWVGSHAEAG